MNFRGLRFHIVALILFRGRLCSSFNNRPNCHASKTLSSTSLHAISTNDGFITITRSNGSRHQLSYRIARPMALSSRQAAPIVTLHGGPSLPSSYLYPLEKVLPYRSIVYYDQLGCGKSDEPNDVSLYSIEDSVHDLKQLIKHLGVRRFHLYGHSYGGILAFEYMKAVASEKKENDVECLSAVLSSAPSDIPQLEKEFVRLTGKLTAADGTLSAEELNELFRVNYQCRLDAMPEELAYAYANAGTVWSGTNAIANYVARPPPEDATRMPSALITRGEFDFVSEDSVQGWKRTFNHKFLRFRTLEGCSHHGLYENGSLYGEIVDSYVTEYD
ncbi:hypothetical protein HJC23_012940 [Cyclotella cryptica]|uniref:AB hydrolase-1 domain-containing protein n=1 Tax=Cyclotella cryptica TaxID=29204 RepID=A0ABD3Q2C2_9STRA|eukprot:CCRYP_009293-RA/>CCRYP_009293-RA protein AED:0.11 eAED:0.11 QI:0/-1/0/1/-1/1/1/0/329